MDNYTTFLKLTTITLNYLYNRSSFNDTKLLNVYKDNDRLDSHKCRSRIEAKRQLPDRHNIMLLLLSFIINLPLNAAEHVFG